MPTSCSLLTAEGVVESVFAGAVSPDELQAAMLGSVDLLRTSGNARVLADLRALAGGHSVSDLFGLVVYLERLGLPAGFREALLVRPGDEGPAPEIRFWEDACRNRGFLVRIFTDRAEAIAWLVSPGG